MIIYYVTLLAPKMPFIKNAFVWWFSVNYWNYCFTRKAIIDLARGINANWSLVFGYLEVASYKRAIESFNAFPLGVCKVTWMNFSAGCNICRQIARDIRAGVLVKLHTPAPLLVSDSPLFGVILTSHPFGWNGTICQSDQWISINFPALSFG